jgi:hypothetical protein
MSRRHSKRSNKARKRRTPATRLLASIANDLRAVQREKGLVPRHLLDSLSNERLLWSYLTCHECREPLVGSLRSLVKQVRTTDRFVAVVDALLALHHVERHCRQVFDEDPETDTAALTVVALRARLQLILEGDDASEHCDESPPVETGGGCVWDQALRWARENFPSLDGTACSSGELIAACQRLIQQFPGIGSKKWLFVYSPDSASDFFEVSGDLMRMMVACAKLGTVASGGGMLLGADFSEKWGTPRCVGKFIPLFVCKPNSPEAAAALHPLEM